MKKIILCLASWCTHCDLYRPEFEELSNLHASEAEFVIEDIEAGDVITKYNIESIPTVIIYEDELEKIRAVGVNDIKLMLKTFF